MNGKSRAKKPENVGKKRLTPKLRFPEFIDQQMRQIYLKDVTSQSNSRNDGRLSTESVMGVSKVDGIVPMEQRVISSDIGRYKIVEKDWFAYNPMRLNIGSIARWQGGDDILVSPDYVVFWCSKEGELGLDAAYLDHFRQSTAWENFVGESGDGGVRVRIYYKDLGLLRLALPSLPEQQRIAACLSSLDNLIGAESRKLDALKAHKKALLQQLFPQEGETTPRLRFPEFQESGEWEEKVLGPLTTKVGSGITPLGGDKNYKKSGRPFIRSQNVGWGQLILDDVAFIDEETHSSFNGTEIHEFDVLLNITGASIGRSALADSRIVGGNVNQHVCIIRLQHETLIPVLLTQYLISDRGQEQIDSFQAGGNRQGLNFAQIRSFSVPVPPAIDEQHRIADCLSALDDLIAAQSGKIRALKTDKKGLMQQLFPAPEEDE